MALKHGIYIKKLSKAPSNGVSGLQCARNKTIRRKIRVHKTIIALVTIFLTWVGYCQVAAEPPAMRVGNSSLTITIP